MASNFFSFPSSSFRYDDCHHLLHCIEKQKKKEQNNRCDVLPNLDSIIIHSFDLFFHEDGVKTYASTYGGNRLMNRKMHHAFKKIFLGSFESRN